MRFTTKSTYGIRAMMYLGERYGTGVVMTREIAEGTGLPGNYLESIMSSLRRAGLVNATRGARGGYEATRSPEEITVADVIAATEGSTELIDCGDGGSCRRDPATCAILDVFADAESAMVEVFRATSLAKLVTLEAAKSAGPGNYSI